MPGLQVHVSSRRLAWFMAGLLLCVSLCCQTPEAMMRQAFKPEGITVGSRVKRGPDWEWGNQDGGLAGRGTVLEMREWKGEPSRMKFGVRVLWDNGNHNTYRWGAMDKFDVEVVGRVDPTVDLRAMRDSMPTVTPSPPPRAEPSELEVLQELYLATNGPKWLSRKGWRQFDGEGFDTANPGKLFMDPCRHFRKVWVGLVCKDGHVHSIDLMGNGLEGRLPDSIVSLPKLVTLSVANNKLSGPLPTNLGRLSSLRWLSYDDNAISGPLPESVSDLRQLEWLSGYNNRHTGPLPPGLGYLSKLSLLRLNHNQFDGPIPSTFALLKSLKTLNLQSTNLRGEVPSGVMELPNLDHTRFRVPRNVRMPKREL